MAITAYWVIPERFMNDKKCELSIDVVQPDPTPITDGNLDPTKYYEILTIDQDIYNGTRTIGDRFTGISADITGKGSVKEISSVWPLKCTRFDAVTCYTSDTQKIVKLILKRHFVYQIRKLSQLEDPTAAQALLVARLQDAHIGLTRQSVFDRWPALEGTTTDGEGNEIPNFPFKEWTCED